MSSHEKVELKSAFYEEIGLHQADSKQLKARPMIRMPLNGSGHCLEAQAQQLELEPLAWICTILS